MINNHSISECGCHRDQPIAVGPAAGNRWETTGFARGSCCQPGSFPPASTAREMYYYMEVIQMNDPTCITRTAQAHHTGSPTEWLIEGTSEGENINMLYRTGDVFMRKRF